MRKGLLAALAGLVLSAAAAPASAAEFGYGGSMRFNYQVGDPGSANVFFLLPDPNETHDFPEYRVRQFFNLEVNDHVSTDVKFEWNAEFGDERQFGGGSGDLQFGGPPATGTSELQFRVKNAFVRFDLPGAPVTLTVGQQDFSTPKALISVEDGTGIKATVKAVGGEHTLWWQKNLNGGRPQTGSDDVNWFGVAPALTFGGLTVSPHLSWARIGADAATGLVSGLLPAAVVTSNSDVWFLGVDTSGKFGGVGFTADLVFQSGDFDTTGGSLDLFSYILDVSATLEVGPGALTIKGLYSPGDDNLGDGDHDAWTNIIATDMGWSPLFHDGSDNGNFVGSVLPGTSVDGGGVFGAGGIMALGVEFALTPVKDLTVTPNAYYLMAAEDTNADGAIGGPNTGDVYGIELGVQASYRVWDAVTVLAQFDYLIADDALQNSAGQEDDVWRFILGPRISW
jgi:hypothetical protein